jgi:hypothetical protein
MGFWNDVAEAVSNAAETVGDAVATAANAVGEAVSDVAETVGNAAEDAINTAGGWLANLVAGTPIIGPGAAVGIRRVFGWAGAVVSGAFDFAGAVVKGVTGSLGGVAQGLIKVGAGMLVLDDDIFFAGLRDIASGLAASALLPAGKLCSLVQATFFLQSPERPLTAEETALLRRIFRKSVALYNVRIVEGWCGLYSLSADPFTLGNTIYTKDSVVDAALLVHEVTHVWQYQQTGSRYATDALAATVPPGNPYDWNAEIAGGKPHWVDFNKEAQAAFIEDLWLKGDRVKVGGALDAAGSGAFYDADGTSTLGRFVFNANDHTARANTAVGVVRRWPAIRLSNLLWA